MESVVVADFKCKEGMVEETGKLLREVCSRLAKRTQHLLLVQLPGLLIEVHLLLRCWITSGCCVSGSKPMAAKVQLLTTVLGESVRSNGSRYGFITGVAPLERESPYG